MTQYSIEPIGILNCPQYYRYQQPRQGSFAKNLGEIVLEGGHNFEQALKDLEGFSHIWIVYIFHLNQTWRPLVNPPVNPDGKKKGLFATRSPHRPNRIGMSCVKLASVIPEERKIIIENFDLLDKTPIVDIKPYILSADCHPEASTGWLPTELDYWRLSYLTSAEKQMEWIAEHTKFDIKEFCQIQLSLDPINGERKRVRQHADGWLLAFRTWRIYFALDETERSITIYKVSSGYTPEELSDPTDTYGDKDVHQKFNNIDFNLLNWP